MRKAPRLKELRELEGHSLRSLAEESGVSAVTIRAVENGLQEPNPATLRALATALGVTVPELVMDPKTLEPATR